MTYPQDPYGPYGQQPHQPYGQQYGQAYGDQYGQPAAQQFAQPYGQQYGYGPGGPAGPSRKSLLTIVIALGAVVVLAIAVVLLFVLRYSDNEAGGAGATTSSAPAPPTAQDAEDLAYDFFQALEDKDETKLNKLIRGEVADDVEEIVNSDVELELSSGKPTNTPATEEVDEGTLAVAGWELTIQGVTGKFNVLMLSEKSEYPEFKVCAVETKDHYDMSDFEEDYRYRCGITSSSSGAESSASKSD